MSISLFTVRVCDESSAEPKKVTGNVSIRGWNQDTKRAEQDEILMRISIINGNNHELFIWYKLRMIRKYLLVNYFSVIFG